ncbi:MAG: hypothetical protein ACK5HU_02730 [Flavobacteriales bacterium]
MKRKELIKKLRKLNIIEDDYSLNEGLKSDAIILEENMRYWKCFYYDERGGITNEQYFIEEEKAYDYIYKTFMEIRSH